MPHTVRPIRSDAEFEAYLTDARARIGRGGVAPSVRWWRRPSDRAGAMFHDVNGDRKTACGLTIPSLSEPVGMEQGPGWDYEQCSRCNYWNVVRSYPLKSRA